MKALRVTALIASVLCLAVLVSPAVASGPITSTTAAPAAEGAFVTAMGIGVAPASASDPFAIGQTLYIGVQSTADSAGLQNAADEMLSRLGAIKAALVDAGVPADGIRLQGLSVNPMFGPTKPGDAPGQKSQTQALTSVNLNGSLSADVPSIRLLIAAMNAATANGATQVNANSGKGGAPFGSVQPPAADLAKATQAAVANARTNAEALAAATGRKVGSIRSISSSQLPMMGCCPPNSGWTVQVTVTFEFAP
ncbi:MAG: DUF541 domain-containing protein [Chloroflexi bacterium]|nr:MAG: DUF541 domain-containing protein [Chloroflexota bacterium]